MVTDFDQPRLQTPNHFGRLSKNMFFARHVAQPRFLRFLTGTAGARVCHVRDDVTHLPAYPSSDLAKSLLSDPRFTIEFPPNSYNEALLRSYEEKIQPKKRRERLLPPLRGWSASGTVVADTENWQRELTRIAEMVGLVTAEELAEIEHKKEPSAPRPTSTSPIRKSPLKSANGEYSQRTGRWNETPKRLSRSRSLSRRTPLSAIVPDHLFCVDEQERETWMIQVLCQILKTDSIEDVRSWLVSSTSNEKEAVRQLIISAIKGLEEGRRIQPSCYLDENAKGIQVNMDIFGSLISNKFPIVSSNQPLPSINENPSKPNSRPSGPSSRVQLTPTTRVFQTNEEKKDSKSTVPQPTKVDVKRDIQVLTLNDDVNPNQQTTNEAQQDEVPF